MTKQMKTWIAVFLGSGVVLFLIFLLGDNGMETAEIAYRMAIFAVLAAMALGILAFVSLRSKKGK